MAFNFYPKQNTLARAENAASAADLSWRYNWIVSGLDLGVPGSGLSPTISDGTAWIAGYVVSIDTETLTVADNATTTVYLGLVRDGNDNVTSATLATTAHTSGDYVVLGTVTAASGDITGVAVTGRSFEDRLTGTDDLRDDAVTTDKIADDAVTTDKLADDAVTVDKLADDAVTVDKIDTSNSPTASDVLKYDGSGLTWGQAGNGWDVIVVKETTETTTTSTMQDDDELFVSVAANKKYFVHLTYLAFNNSGNGMGYIFTAPSGSAFTGDRFGVQAAADASWLTTNNNTGYSRNRNFLTEDVYGIGGFTTCLNYVNIYGVLTTSSTAGTLQFRWRGQGTPITLSVDRGSVLRIKDIT
jgi:hypothetical protein